MATKSLSVVPYLVGYLELVVLAGLSLAFARGIQIPSWSLAVNLTVAVLQAGVVLWVFMHLDEASFQIRFSLGVGVSLVLTLLLLTVADVATRHVQPPAPRPGPAAAFYGR